MSDPNCGRCHGKGYYDDAEPGDISFNTFPCNCRMSRNQMLMNMAVTAAERSTCNRKKVGAIIASEGRAILTGYAGAPSGMPHCLEQGCLIGPSGGCLRTVHAEANAIAFAARKGIRIEDSTLICTLSPCYDCAKLIINAGITFVFYKEKYRDESGIGLLISADIVVANHA